MSRFISNANLASALLSSRRGFSSAAAAVTKRSAVEEKMMMTKGSKRIMNEAETASSWVPDPVTGYYRPANRLGDFDPAELRNILLSRKS